ncbi:MAG: hypothetical protein ACYC5M_02090 [Anaerolineae bacterium]
MHTKRVAIWVSALLITVMILAVGCTSRQDQAAEPARLGFEVALGQTNGRVVIEVQVRNVGGKPLPGTVAFDGTMELLDGEGTRLGRMEIPQLNRTLAPGETQVIASSERALEPGLYRVVWGAAAYGGTTLDFTVFERDGVLDVGEGWVRATPDPTSQPGPTAEADPDEKANTEMQGSVELAIADLAAHLDVTADQVRVVEVQPTEFRDSSLGVPEEGMMYAQVITPGHVITLQVGDETYVYHGAVDRVVRVPR